MDSNQALVALYEQPGPPAEYVAELEKLAPSITDKIEQVQTPGESWIDALSRIVPSILATVQQRELLQIQVERARAGLPPLDVSAYTPGVAVGLSKDTKELLMYGAIGAAAVYLLTSRRRWQ